MILSHHGQLEFGSPKVPQFPEALLLHYLDDMDSKMECMRALIENDRQVDGCFTVYSASLERSVLKMERYMADEAVPAPRAPAPQPTMDMTADSVTVAPSVSEGLPGAQPLAATQPPAATQPLATQQAMTPPKQHTAFTPKSDSPFADKLRQALQPVADSGHAPQEVAEQEI